MKFVYAISSTASDHVLEKTYVSMLSLKHYMPEAQIVLVVDKSTSETLWGRRKEESSLASEIVEVEINASLPLNLKTSMVRAKAREAVRGDIFILSADTVINGVLEGFESATASVNAVLEAHVPFSKSPYREIYIRSIWPMGWDCNSFSFVLNQNVIYAKDDESASGFFKVWQEKILQGAQAGVTEDFPPFVTACKECKDVIGELPAQWNCQLVYGVRYLNNMKVLNYTHRISDPIYVLDDKTILDKIAFGGEFPELLKSLLEDPLMGIESPCQLCAGEDVRMHRKPEYRELHKWSVTGDRRYGWIEKIIRLIK